MARTMDRDRAKGPLFGLTRCPLHGIVRHRNSNAPVRVDNLGCRRLAHHLLFAEGTKFSALKALDVCGYANDAMRIVTDKVRLDKVA